VTDHPALVTRPAGPAEPAKYLSVNADGALQWVADPAKATAFASMREAARMALRLPAAVRAFGLPRDVELHAYA